MTKFLLSLGALLGLTFASLDAGAIRVVGKGGGYAEMQLHSLNERLPAVLLACLSGTGTCGLESESASILKFALRGRLQIDIDTECRSPGLSLIGSSQVRIPACELYRSSSSGDPMALAAKELAGLVLQARLMSFVQMPASQSQALAARVLQDFSFGEKSWAGVVDLKNILFHVLTLSRGSHTEALLMLESNEKTENVTSLILAKLDCDADRARVLRAGAASVENVQGDYGQVNFRFDWTCEASGQEIHSSARLLFDTALERFRVHVSN